MRNKKFQLFLLFLISIFIVFAFPLNSFPQVSQPVNSQNLPFLDKVFLQNLAIAVLSALLSFFGGYALSSIGRRRESKRQLSYSSMIETGLVNIEKEIKKKVEVLYDNRPVANLSNICFLVENTGNSVLKGQEIRFEFFPDSAKILDFYFDPKPLPEMKVEELTDARLKNSERKCRIGHLERGQSVGIRFLVTSESEIKLVPHPFNEDGDVDFISRTVNKALSQRDQIARFLSLLIMYFVVPPIFLLFPLSPFAEAIAGLVRLALLLALFRFIVPFSEVIAEILTKLLSPDSKLGESQYIFSGGIEGNVVINESPVNTTDSKEG
jgi:hypothetical protein